MGNLTTDSDNVEFASDDDVQAGVERSLAELGMTYEELEAQAKEGEFASERARLTWFMISPDVEHC
ncbi:MAG: hypothetical protein ACSLFB_11410 [Acidimicrobiales bacterium]